MLDHDLALGADPVALLAGQLNPAAAKAVRS
jgi:hypothetical protein